MSRILYVAYPLLPVTRESAGGAEQMLLATEREMAARGYQTSVAACEGSEVTGRLIATGRIPQGLDSYREREIEHNTRVNEHVSEAVEAGLGYDLIHDKSGSFWRNGASVAGRVLATLHLPRNFYDAEWFTGIPENVFFNCVSQAQACTFAGLSRMMGVVQNGIAGEDFPFSAQKKKYLLWMGRICEEKGAHVAIEVAERTGMRLILAGQIYPFSYHQQYYERCVRPHLGKSRVTFVDTPRFEQKIELLRDAYALLLPSLCEETSSLVSLEAMACGTPVVAFRRGGIPEIVAHGETGFVVDTTDQMVEAVKEVDAISPIACHSRVRTRFSIKRMADDYERMYRAVSGFQFPVSSEGQAT